MEILDLEDPRVACTEDRGTSRPESGWESLILLILPFSNAIAWQRGIARGNAESGDVARWSSHGASASYIEKHHLGLMLDYVSRPRECSPYRSLSRCVL